MYNANRTLIREEGWERFEEVKKIGVSRSDNFRRSACRGSIDSNCRLPSPSFCRLVVQLFETMFAIKTA
jgi:hypothetical protein